MERCKKIIHKNDGTFFGSKDQCKNSAKLEGYCSIHHPDKVAERHAKRYQRLEAEKAKRRAHHDKIKTMREALELIASRKLNDPAGYAKDLLEKI